MFGPALTAIVILLIIFGSAITIVWLGTRYAAAKKGFVPGGNRQELQSIYQTMEKMQQDIEEIKATLADLVIQLHDRQ
jgi:Na+-translocating ferredoxin:NAD+ oxidoreductase RnfD subunit